MDYTKFENSLFPVFVGSGMKISYCNSQARRLLPSVRVGESLTRVLHRDAYDLILKSRTAVPVKLREESAEKRFFAFSENDGAEVFFVGAASPLPDVSECVRRRFFEFLPETVVNSPADASGASAALRGADVPFLPDGNAAYRSSLYDFGVINAVDLSALLSDAYERITKRFHVLGLKLKYFSSGDSFRCRVVPDEFTYFVFVMSYLSAAFPNAELKLTGGDFVSAEFSCGAGDGSERSLGKDEFFSFLGINGFTLGMLILCSRYFDMLICRSDGAGISAKLVLPASLSFLFSECEKAVGQSLALLDDYLMLI
ncbi:MAG: hypothetical protein J5940_06160 [Clostridia bacterium]|nr:hypothetical protein [Clostridia bacterium]